MMAIPGRHLLNEFDLNDTYIINYNLLSSETPLIKTSNKLSC